MVAGCRAALGDADALFRSSLRRPRRRPLHVSGETGFTSPAPDGAADRLHLLDREGHRGRGWLAQPNGVTNRVLGKRFVAHRKAEREAEHGPCLLAVL